MSCCFYRITNWSVPKHVFSVCHGNLQTASRTKWIFIVICWGFNYGVYWYYDIFIKHARVFPLSLHLFITVSDCTRTGCRNSNQEVLRKWHFEMVVIPFSLVLFSTGKILSLVTIHRSPWCFLLALVGSSLRQNVQVSTSSPNWQLPLLPVFCRLSWQTFSSFV